MMSHDTPEFISPLQWPPNSRGLNPVDYAIWGILQERVYRTRIRDVDHLVELLVKEWFRFDHEIISAAVIQRPSRLRVCVCVKGDGAHFEHFL